jgi:hypothetical protein
MLNQYVKFFTRLHSGRHEKPNSERTGNTPRSGNFSTRRHNFSTKSGKDEIFGTGTQWGSVDSSVESRGDMLRTESQENIVGGLNGIQRTVDVEMWHTDGRSDGRSDESLRI